MARPVVIEVRGVDKRFRIPEHRIDSFKERATRPLMRVEYREHQALRGVSFDVHRGEFFGIVGRNGSGKSSLLKILASIYQADAGRVRVAGRMAPFIELGVGFNPELTARENVVLNGVLMGLTLREARRRLDAVLEFAELEHFVDLKLKNYSSGMMVRLAFAITVESHADIMLIDEVLAVGDAAFGQKCLDVFHERRRAGKTLVLITHDMAMVQSLCHRGMVLHDGEVRLTGGPEDVAQHYLRLNFGEVQHQDNVELDLNARVVRAELHDVERGVPLQLDVAVEAARDLTRTEFLFHVVNEDGLVVIGFTRRVDEPIAAGHRIHLAGQIENRLAGGRYVLHLFVREHKEDGAQAVQGLRLARFLVSGPGADDGLVEARTDIEPVVVRDVRAAS